MAGKGDPKIARIKAWVALMTGRDWAITEEDVDITTQLLNYDFTKKDQEDDIIDSCAYGPVMMIEFLPIIKARAAGFDLEINYAAQSEAEVSGV